MTEPLPTPDYKKYFTKLPVPQEIQYQSFAKAHDFIPDNPTYDYRGWYQAYVNPKDPNHDLTVQEMNPYDHSLHYNDYWKTPLHPSFSMQSKYWTPSMGFTQWSPQGNDYGSANPLRGLLGNVLYDESTKARFTPEGLGTMLNRVLQSYYQGK